MPLLEGKVAIVTGGGRGLGRAHAIELARHGAAVVVNDIGVPRFTGEGEPDAAPAEEVVQAIALAGGHAVASLDDIAEWDGALEVIRCAVRAYGRLDIVVNNAGIARFSTIDQVTKEDWARIIAVNLTGTAAVCHWAAAYWRAEGPGVDRRIVNTSSGVGLTPVQGSPMYVAAKAGVAALTVSCAIELANLGVRANALAPVARTRISEFVAGEEVKWRHDAFDTMNPDNAAAVVAFLSSPACAFTGRVFGIVGDRLALYDGWSVGRHFDNHAQRWTIDELSRALSDVPLQSVSQAQMIGGVVEHLTPSAEVLNILSSTG